MSTQDKDLAMSTHGRGGVRASAYLLALPPFLFLLIFTIIPFITFLLLPFKEYDPEVGIRGTSWVGMENFRHLFGMDGFSRVLGNTIILKIEYILFCCIAAFLLTLILGCIRTRFWQRFFSTIFLFPYFIPTVVFSYLTLFAMGKAGIFFIFSSESLADPRVFRIVYPTLEVIKNIGIPVIMALGAINAKRESDESSGFLRAQLIPALKAIGLFALIQLSALLTMDYELLTSFRNLMVYQVADTIDTFTYRTNLMYDRYSIAGAAHLLRYILQTVLSILVYFIIKKYFVEDNFAPKAIKTRDKKRRFAPVAVVAGLFIVEIYLLLTTAPLAISVFEAFKHNDIVTDHVLNWSSVYSSFITYLPAVAFAVLVNAIFTILLAYPLTVKNLPGRSVYAIFLVMVLNIGAGGVHEYLFFKRLNMMETIWPYIITGFFTLVNVFVLKSIYNAKYKAIEERTVKGVEGDIGSFFKRYLPRVLKPVLGLSALQYAFMWNSYYPAQAMYTVDHVNSSPVMMFLSIMTSPERDIYGALTPEMLKLATMVSIPGIIILLLVMIFGYHEIFIGQIRKS